jgi:hypothetical protein
VGSIPPAGTIPSISSSTSSAVFPAFTGTVSEEQVAQILKRASKTVDARYYPNESCDFAKREDHVDAVRQTIDRFERYLMNR